MSEWTRVKWTEAGQVVSFGDEDATADKDWSLPPSDYFGRLRAQARREEAVKFLALALPRLEAVAWAARTVRDMTADAEPKPSRVRALRSALLWVSDPRENRRRAAHEAAQDCDMASAERLVAMGAFCSGGSIAPDDCPAVQPPRNAAGLFASGAVLYAAAVAPNRLAALDRALDAGARIAQDGLEAGE
jgi:hypothetical protein